MSTAEKHLIEQLAAAVAEHIKPSIPVALDLWSAKEIAAYLKRSERQVTERYAALPSFPKAIRLPVLDGGRGQPLWRAKEIMDWAQRFQDK